MKFKEIRCSNYIEEVRRKLEEVIAKIDAMSNTDTGYNLGIIKYFEFLREEDYDAYTQLIGLAISDHYKLLYYKEQTSILNEEDRQNLELYSGLYDNEDIINLIEGDPIFILNAINGLIDFDIMDYFNKRETLMECEPIMKQLVRFSSLNIYDLLYYNPKPYNIGTFKMIYEDCLNDNDTKEEAIESLICTLDEIYIASDGKNEYFEIVSELLTTYYIIGKYELTLKVNVAKKATLEKTIKFLESSDTLEIIGRLYESDFGQKNKFLVEVFKRYINFKDKELVHNQIDKCYQKTLKKLWNIKEFNNERNNNFGD